MRASLRRLLGGRSAQDDFQRATEQDVYYCYRLFLNREPDEAGWAFWTGMVRDHHISLQNLTDAFLNGDELEAIQRARSEPILVELPEFSIYVRPNDFLIGAVIAREKQFEPHVTHMLKKLLAPGMTFMDIGAHVGYFTLLAAGRVGPEGKVLAFEAHPDNCDLLERSVAANGFENVAVHRFAVAEERRTFQLATSGSHRNARIVDGQSEPYQLPDIEAVSLDELLDELPRLDVVKMDIEGAEPRAWSGMRGLLARRQPIIVFEYAPALIKLTSRCDPPAFLDEVRSAGFDLYRVEDDPASVEGQRPLDGDQLRRLSADLQTHADHADLMAVPGGRRSEGGD